MEIKVYGSITITDVTDGAPGRGIVSETSLYYLSTSDKNPPEISDTAMASGYWREAFPTEWASNNYIWTTTRTEWTDGETTYSPNPPTLIGQIEAATTSAQLSEMSLADWCVSHNITIIDGSVITTGSISADKMDVSDLNAFNATIGGWTINSDSIYKDSVKLSTGKELYDSLIEGHTQSPLRISAGTSATESEIYETCVGTIPDYVDEPTAYIKSQYDAGNDRLVDGACTTYYREFIDSTAQYADGFHEPREDVFSAYGYLPNNEGVMTLVLYKGDTFEYQEPDWREPFFYDGQATIDGVVYDKWRKIVNPNAGGGDPDVYTWTSAEKQYAYTNVIAVDNSHIKQRFSVQHRTRHFHIENVGVTSIYCDNPIVEMHVAENGVVWTNDVVTVNLEIDNPKASYSGESFSLEIQYTPAANAPFQILEDGSLYAGAASIKGDVRATSGYIGEWEIDAKQIFAVSDSGRIYLMPEKLQFGLNDVQSGVYNLDAYYSVGIEPETTVEYELNCSIGADYYLTDAYMEDFYDFDAGLEYSVEIVGRNTILLTLKNPSDHRDTMIDGHIVYQYEHKACEILSDGTIQCKKAHLGATEMGNWQVGNWRTIGKRMYCSAPTSITSDTLEYFGLMGYSGNGSSVYSRKSLRHNKYSPTRIFVGGTSNSTDDNPTINTSNSEFSVLADGSTYASALSVGDHTGYHTEIGPYGDLEFWREATEDVTEKVVSIKLEGGGEFGLLEGNWEIGSLESSTPIASDVNKKHEIQLQPEVYSRIFDRLKPVTYKYNNGTSDRIHTGFIAQDVEAAVLTEGLTTQDLAALCYDTDDKGNKTNYGIRYEEIVSMNTYEIQKLKARVAELEAQVSRLQAVETRMAELERKMALLTQE